MGDGRLVLFLDFDGVLNSREWMLNRGAFDEIGPRLDTEAVERLNGVLDETGAVVVVSSSWRNDASVDDLRGVLESNGFDGEVIDKTRNLDSGERRGDVIREWVDEHPDISGYAVVDDIPEAVVGPIPAGNVVETSYDTGLTDETAEELRETLEWAGND